MSARSLPLARALACGLGALVIACGAPDERPWREAEWTRIASMSPVPVLPPSPDNTFADDEQAAELGRALFFETRWSAGGTTSCASCHDPSREHADGRDVARARGRLARNTPSLRGSAWMRWQGWDGGRDSVWAQSLVPLEQDLEHGSSRTRVAQVVAAHHAAAYQSVFGALPRLEWSALPDDAGPAAAGAGARRAWDALRDEEREAIDRVFTDVGRALEAYVRRLHPGTSRFDRYVRAVRAGDRRAAELLSPSERRGLRAFVGEARCFDCHHGPLLSDGEFHNLGLPMAIGVPDTDHGRARGARAVRASEHRCGHATRARRPDAPECAPLRFLDTSIPELVGAFRTPTLRNVSRTAPYMHGGQLATLTDVLEFYRALPGAARVGHRTGALRPLPRGVSIADLAAFLGTLDGDPVPERWRGIRTGAR